MTYPTVNVNLTNLDVGTDNPALARTDLLDLATKFNGLRPLPADLAASSGASLVGNGGETVAQSFDALQLTDYAALRAYAGPRKSVYVTGYLVTSAPSGISGVFIRDDADTTTADNGGTVIVTALGKRYKRALSSEVLVQWFGAKGDGVTNDTAAIQAAINYAFANRRDVTFAQARFRCNQILLPQNATEPVKPFHINGNGAEIIVVGTNHLFSVNGTFFYDLFVHDLHFEGTAAGLYASEDSKIFNTQKIMRLVVNSCSSRYINTVFACPATFYAQSVTANNFVYRGGSATGYFFRADIAFDISLNDCLVEQSYNGLKIVPVSGVGNLQASSRVTVRGGAWESLAGVAIATNSTYQLTVDNVYFEGNSTDINVSYNASEGAHMGLTITNNDFYLSAGQLAADYYPVIWGSSAQKSYRTGGNKSNGNLHDITGATGAFNFAGDYAGGKLYNGMNTATVRVGNTPVGKAQFSDGEGNWSFNGQDAIALLPGAGGIEMGKIANADLINSKIVRPKFLVGSLNPATNPATYASTEFCRGSFVHNSVPTELGTTPNKYLILGWKCITSGVGGNSGTDRWLECRALTGN